MKRGAERQAPQSHACAFAWDGSRRNKCLPCEGRHFKLSPKGRPVILHAAKDLKMRAGAEREAQRRQNQGSYMTRTPKKVDMPSPKSRKKLIGIGESPPPEEVLYLYP